MSTHLRSIILAITTILTLGSALATARPGAVELDVIVMDGDQAPGTTGQFDLGENLVDKAASTAIDDSGKVWFFAGSNEIHPWLGPIEGIWAATGLFTEEIALNGQKLPQFQPDPVDCFGDGDTSCGMLWNTQEHFYVTADGIVTLRSTREDAKAPISYLVGSNSPTLSPVLLSTDTSAFHYSPVLALRTLSGTYQVGPFIGSKPFGEPDGGLTDWVTPFIGGAAPFIVDPVVIDDIIGTYLTDAGVTFGYNQSADMLYIARLSDGSDALYFDPMAAGPSKLLARSGVGAVDIFNSEIVQISYFASAGQTGNARINDAGQGYFWGTWRKTDLPINNSNLPRKALWRFSKDSEPELVVSEYLNPTTDIAFETGEFAATAFDKLTIPNIAANGDIYFFAWGRQLSDAGFPDRSDERVGLWRAPADGGPLQLVLRKTTSDTPGSPLPNGPDVPGTSLPGGDRFESFGPDGYGLDEHSHLVFDTQDALYAEDDAGFRLVIKDGQEMEIGPGDIRTVSEFRLNVMGHVSGQTQAYRNDKLVFRVRYTDNSRAILRTRFLPPPPPASLVGLEAVQVVQDWENSVKLYRNKPTLVRAHLRDDFEDSKKVILRVFDQSNSEFPWSPLPAEAPGGLAFVGPETVMDRGEKWASANFTLPMEATTGPRIRLLVQIEEDSLECDEAAPPTPKDCSLEVQFDEPRVPQIKIVSLNYKSSGVTWKVNRLARMDLARRLVSAYPIEKTDWVDAEVYYGRDPTAGKEIHRMYESLEEARRQRTLDKCSTAKGCKRIYYTAMNADSLSGLATLDGYQGTGFVRSNPRRQGRHTHTHEFGHSLARSHSVGDPPRFPLKSGDKRGPCGSTANVSTAAFPHLHQVATRWRQTFGPMDQGDDKLVYGWDSSQHRTIDPNEFFDLMGYCSDDIIDMWPSKHTYSNIATKLDSRYAAALLPAEILAVQDYWVINGSVVGGSVTLQPLMRLDAAEPPDVSPPGNWEVRLLDVANHVLDTTTFAPEVLQIRGLTGQASAFLAALPVNVQTRKIQVFDGSGTLAAEILASPNPPTVAITSPNGGETLNGETTTITWNSADSDGDPLSHAVQFSGDNGTTWETLISNTSGQQLEVATDTLTQSNQGRIRVVTTDGFHHVVDGSDGSFNVPDSVPSVAINMPGDESWFYDNDSINFRMMAFDTEDGELEGAALEWISDIDGALGNGTDLATNAMALSSGTHIITARATDSGAGMAETQITIHVGENAPGSIAEIGVLLTTDLPGKPPAAEPFLVTVVVESQGADDVSDAGLDIELSLQAVPDHAGPQALIGDMASPEGWSCLVNGLTLSCVSLDIDANSQSELQFMVTIDRPALLTITADISSAVSDPVGSNNRDNLNITVDIADQIFEDGFEL